ncbi:AraC family transcriptional regulator [Hyalangium sp.]|uniref:AraC family transcriptional regulator n=1 Tax=Hyalangium sp. TaxID=2028555 RepID=UPI002D74E13D|nr:AraC family transcriptional regulator [Hyalangium sp.]HYI00081.1 AraC family transcriptional regulator [Hyalangium sp.]
MTSWTRHLRALLALAVLSVGVARADAPVSPKLGGDSKSLPVGWFVTQSAPHLYEAGVDRNSPCEGIRSAFLRSRMDTPTGYGTFMQAFGAKDFRGKRLRFSAAVRVKDVAGWAGLWMRVEGADSKQPLGFDNMQSRSLSGTTACKRYDVVLDVPQEAEAVMAGLLLSGTGQAWLDGVRFEVVDHSVPVTDLLAARRAVPQGGPHGLEEVAAAAAVTPREEQLPTGKVGDIWFNLGRVNMDKSYTRGVDGIWRNILDEEVTEHGNEVKGTFLARAISLKVTTEGTRTLIEGTWGSDPVRIQLDPERLTMKSGIYEREMFRDTDYKKDPNCFRYLRVEGPRVTDRLDICGAALSTKPPPAQLALTFLGNGFRRVKPPGGLPPPLPPMTPRDAMQAGTNISQ